MNTTKCDLLIIGGGPAGLTAAESAAKNGLNVICVEKKTTIGAPVKCAEGIGSYLLPHLPFKLPEHLLEWPIEGMRFHVFDKFIDRTGDFWKGHTINRTKFEEFLASRTKKEGAKILLGTELTDLSFKEKYGVKSAIVENDKKTKINIKPKAIIAADGSESTVLNLLGLHSKTPDKISAVISWEMTNLELETTELEQVFIGDFAPGGYAYIFPKSNKTANIGVGAAGTRSDMHELFEKFMQTPIVKKQTKNAKYVIEKSKIASWGDFSSEWVYDNIILAGDAANHNLKPFIEGILPAVISGNLAGVLAKEYCDGLQIHSQIYKTRLEKELGAAYTYSNAITPIIRKIFASKDKRKHLLFAGLVAQVFEIDRLKELEELEFEELESQIMNPIKK